MFYVRQQIVLKGPGGNGSPQMNGWIGLQHTKCFLPAIPPGIVLFLHAFTGCDTTCALFRQGKMKMLYVLSKQPDLLEVATTFLNYDATHEEIASAGNKCLVALYGGGEDDSLNALRYGIFLRSAANAKVHLARLPPTEEADGQHSYRTYHQVQK